MESLELTTVLGLLVALSAASERLVEIIKGLVPWLNEDKEEAIDDGAGAQAKRNAERWRKLALQVLAGLAGIATAWAAYPAIPVDFLPAERPLMSIVALGLLASGGSGLWNALLTWALESKNIRESTSRAAAAQVRVLEELEGRIVATTPLDNDSLELVRTFAAAVPK